MVLIYTFFKLSGSEKYKEGVLEKGVWISTYKGIVSSRLDYQCLLDESEYRCI